MVNTIIECCIFRIAILLIWLCSATSIVFGQANQDDLEFARNINLGVSQWSSEVEFETKFEYRERFAADKQRAEKKEFLNSSIPRHFPRNGNGKIVKSAASTMVDFDWLEEPLVVGNTSSYNDFTWVFDDRMKLFHNPSQLGSRQHESLRISKTDWKGRHTPYHFFFPNPFSECCNRGVPRIRIPADLEETKFSITVNRGDDVTSIRTTEHAPPDARLELEYQLKLFGGYLLPIQITSNVFEKYELTSFSQVTFSEFVEINDCWLPKEYYCLSGPEVRSNESVFRLIQCSFSEVDLPNTDPTKIFINCRPNVVIHGLKNVPSPQTINGVELIQVQLSELSIDDLSDEPGSDSAPENDKNDKNN